MADAITYPKTFRAKTHKLGLSVHMNQVHKETLNSVDNALPNRAGLDVEIFGMEGIPEDVIASHNNRVIQQFYEAEAERRKTSGNPAPGSKPESTGPKKPKLEQPSDLKKRLAEHKAKKAAMQAGSNSGSGTPIGAGQAASPPGGHNASAMVRRANLIQLSSCLLMILLQPAVGSPFGSNVVSYNGSHGSPPAVQPFQPPGAPPYAQQSHTFPQPMHASASSSAAPGVVQPGAGFNPPPAAAGFQTAPGTTYPPGQQFSKDPPSLPSINLPGAMGLPQRPVFPGSQSQGPIPPTHMQASGSAGLARFQASGESQTGVNGKAAGYPSSTNAAQNAGVPAGVASSTVDGKLVDSGKNAEAISAAKKLAAEASTDKKSSIKKDRSMRLIYSDNDVSPEEKMAALPRYMFEKEKKQETVLGTVTASVTGIAAGPDDVIDKQG